MLFLTNKKEMYKYANRHSTGVVKTLRSFIKERHILKIILIIIMNIGGKFLEELWAVSVLQYNLVLSTGLIM